MQSEGTRSMGVMSKSGHFIGEVRIKLFEGGVSTHAVRKIGRKIGPIVSGGGVVIDYFNAKRLMLITSRTPDPVMVKA